MVIQPSNISVVVQGPVIKAHTQSVLLSIRNILPGAEIILSTWENSNVTNLEYDILVLNQDPSYFYYNIDGRIHKYNVNRQILSTKEGLKKATRQFSIKLRSDTKIINKNFINYFAAFMNKENKNKILDERLVICELFCANPHQSLALFLISDWFCFGYTKDVFNLWNIPLQSEKDGYYFNGKLKNAVLARYLPEQYIFIEFLKKNNLTISYDNYKDNYSSENKILTDILFANNFVIVDYKDIGIKILSEPYNSNPYIPCAKNEDIYNHCDWLQLYRKYCDPNYKIPFQYFLQNNNELKTYKSKIKKHIKAFLWNPFTKWFLRPFAIGYYGFKLITNLFKFLFSK